MLLNIYFTTEIRRDVIHRLLPSIQHIHKHILYICICIYICYITYEYRCDVIQTAIRIVQHIATYSCIEYNFTLINPLALSC